MELKRVVITGMGALTPIGNNLEDYWNALLAGTSGAAPITRFDASLFKTQFACELKGFDINQYMDRKEARKHDFFSQYGIVASDEAVADSGILDDSRLDKERVGVIWASGIGGLISLYHEVCDFAKGDGTPRFNPFFIPKMIADIAAGHISIRNGFKGPNFATVSACASSANALAEAYMYIRLGKADAFVCGGSEAAVTPAGIGFNSMHALSTRNDDPKTASRPFDKDRDGFVLGEGAGGLVVEELEHAKARGAKIYAEIVGSGLTADAYHMTAPQPEGISVARAMHLALEDGHFAPSDVDYINTHGTSTPAGDVAEVLGIKRFMGEDAYKVNINSTKSCTGHLLGAAGAIEAIATALAVKNDIVPPTINHFTDDPELDGNMNYTFGAPQKRRVGLALNNTFGFGGHNVSMAFKKYEE